MDPCVVPLRKCPSIIDFLKCMYDILEAHRWTVLECNVIRQDISHCNILVQDKGVERTRDRKFTNDEHRPIFVDEVLENVRTANPTAHLVDMDNAAEPDTEAVSFLTWGHAVSMKDRRLRHRGGIPRFIARSPAVGRLLVKNVNFRPMPVLNGEIAEKYAKAYCNDHSEGLRTCVDDASTLHGGVYNVEKVRVKHDRDRNLKSTEFEHRLCHDAESVFWCMVAFLLLAVPLGSAPEELGNDPEEDFPLYNAWQCMATHEIGALSNNGDSRLRLLDDGYWESWLHPELSHVGQLLYLLAVQVDPEWALLEPQPHILHLHEALQRLILEHIDLWTREKKDVKFDMERIRPLGIPDNRAIPRTNSQVPRKPQVMVADGVPRPKRQSHYLGPKEESQTKRCRITRWGTYESGEVHSTLPPSLRLYNPAISLDADTFDTFNKASLLRRARRR